MTDSIRSQFVFPVGYHQFHKDQLFNFQLNRWYSLDYARFEDMREAGQKIDSFEEWKSEMLRLAEIAVSRGRLLNAGFYYRAAEFYTFQEDSDKESLYDKFIELFYGVFQNDQIGRFQVPYTSRFLPAMRIPPESGKRRGTIVMHGGFDSLIEEFYSWMRFFSNRGYEVVAFEGPGQGAARRKYGLALDYRWEEPTKAVFDYFQLNDVTLLGISMGGWFCFRAGAFEPRIRRIIASSIAFDYMQFPNILAQQLGKFFFTYLRSLTDKMAMRKMKKDPMHAWTLGNLMYITKKRTPMDAMDVAMQLNERNVHSDRVKQDVLILTGQEEQFIPLKMHAMQVKALTREVCDLQGIQQARTRPESLPNWEHRSCT